jgi:Na+-driven multidrug efflux pump
VADNKTLWKSFVVFLAPMMLSNVLQSLFGTINNLYLGQMIGVEALAAVSVLFPVVLARRISSPHLAQRLLHMMRASGTVFAPMALSILAIAAVEVPSAVILSRSIGVEGIWAAYPITFTAMFILQMSYYVLVWRRRTVQRLI